MEVYEHLFQAEEPGIREKALEGLRKALQVYDSKKKEGELVALIKRVASYELPTAKSMAPPLIVIAASLVSSASQNDLLK